MSSEPSAFDPAHGSASDDIVIRRLGSADLPAYKALRDEMLAAHPEAFTSDAESERSKEPLDYLHRLGLDRRDGGQFVIGAWRRQVLFGDRLVGAIGLEREERKKVAHVGHVIGMMVRPQARGRGIGARLIDACIADARSAGIELLTLTVTTTNTAAVRLYERQGFVAYGLLEGALKLDGGYQDKLHMAFRLR